MVQTDHVSKRTIHLFDLSANFKYSTSYVHRIDKKYFELAVWHHNTVVSDDLIGKASVDLLTVVTGPVRFFDSFVSLLTVFEEQVSHSLPLANKVPDSQFLV